MSVEFSEEESHQAVEFLQHFSADRKDIGDEDTLPFRVVPFVGQDELQGDCIEWSLEYLRRNKCSEELGAIIVNHVVSELLQRDLSAYKLEEENKYDASRLARLVFNTVHHVCQQWSQDPPPFFKSEMTYESSVCAIKNTRRKMEDKHIILPNFNSLFGLPKDSPNYAYFAVYDGHGGIDAATYAAAHLHCFLAHDPNLTADPGLALHGTFMNTDKSFAIKAEEEGLRSGCTAVSVLITNDTMYIAWLGDSQVILCKDGELIELMQPHKPERLDEKERIEALGGCVVWFGAWRVNGSLSVSRAIGDFEHKPYISSEPDVAEYTFDGDEEFLILACDGLWDCVKPENAIKLVKEHIAEGSDRNSVAKLLVNQAKEGGSSDNISVLVVFLDAHHKEITKSEISSKVQDKVDVVQDEKDIPQNGTHQSDNQSINVCVTVKSDNQEEIKSDSSDTIVARVKISTETVIERTTDNNMTCKVTCKDGGAVATSKSAGSSPKQSPRMPCRGGGGSVKVGKARGSSPKQLDVKGDSNGRRNSAPETLSV